MNSYAVYVHGMKEDVSVPLPMTWFSDEQELFAALETETAAYVIVTQASRLRAVDFSYILSIQESFDLIHAGLTTGMVEVFGELQVTALSWFFLNPDSSFKSVNWKADADFFMIRPTLFREAGGLDKDYSSWSIRVADLSYRLLRSGGKVFYDPHLISGSSVKKEVEQIDLFRFIRSHVTASAAIFYLHYAILHGHSISKSIQNFMATRSKGRTPRKRIIWKTPESKVKSIQQYSAIIPTLDRYAYLPAAVQSLFDQEFPPDDVVVYDQTPKERRETRWSEKFPEDRLKVIFSDTPGQSTARNEALKRTKHEWCLLFDDDSLALPDMASQHRNVIEFSDFAVSTGASLAPSQTLMDMPYDVDYLHLTDVLDTGNCFIHKSLWEDVKGFDSAFDRGPGADNDFGTRLYLRGVPIVFNNKAIRIHYKATTGGLRNFGVWWRFKTSVKDPYPPPSQTYTVMKYYSPKFWSFIFLRFFLKASYRQNFFQVAALWILYPFKLRASKKRARELGKLNTQ